MLALCYLSVTEHGCIGSWHQGVTSAYANVSYTVSYQVVVGGERLYISPSEVVKYTHMVIILNWIAERWMHGERDCGGAGGTRRGRGRGEN